MDHFTVLLFVACAWTQAVVGVMQDCWDPEKLARMNFKQTPGTSSFFATPHFKIALYVLHTT